MAVSILIPAFNEEERIGATIKGASQLPDIGQIVVVDDGSRDRTATRALQAGAEVIKLKKNGGKGYALNEGSKYITGDIILLLDADIGETAREAEKLLLPVKEGSADLTIGIFPSQAGGGFGLAKKLAGWGVKRLGGLNLKAPLSGQRAMNRSTWLELQPFPAGYGVEVASCIASGRKGLRVVEVEVNMGHNATGRDLAGFYHRGRQFYHISTALAKVAGQRLLIK